jgi:hypothetical protein
VTDGTIDLPPDVRLVIEFHIVGGVVNPHPRYRGLRVEMPSLPYNLGMLGDNIFVTKKTLAHRGDACVLRSVHVRMAEPAIDFLHTGMNPMTEIDGLFGADRLSGIEIVKVKHHPEQDS